MATTEENILQTLTASGEAQKRSNEKLAEIAQLNIDSEKRQEAADADQKFRDMEQKAREEKLLQSQSGILGYFSWARKFQERAAKAAKIAAQSAVDFGKAKLKSVQQFAGNMLDLLLKGLGLAALWALFKFLSENSWEETVNKVKGWLGDIGIEWDSLIETLDGIWVVLTRLGGSFWVFKALVGTIRTWFGFSGVLGTLLKFVWGFGFNMMFKAGGAIWSILKWIGGKFGVDGFIAKQLKLIKESSFFGKWFGPDSKIQGVIKWIKGIFGAEGKVGTFLKSMKGSVAGKFTAWFGEGSKIRSIFSWIGGFFGSADEGGKIAKAIQALTQNKLITGIGKFLGSIGGKMLKFFGPIGWLMAGYDAVMAFWEAFQSEEGSLWDKTVAGLSAGIQAIVDFFIFDLIGIAEKSIKWLIKKVLSLFGMDEKEIEASDWYNFSITGFIKDMFGDLMTLIEGILTWDTEKMGAGISGLFGAFGSIADWIFDMVVKTPINWIAKNIFGMEDDVIGEDFSFSGWIKSIIWDPIVEFFTWLFNIDWMALAKDWLPGPIYNWLFNDDETTGKAFESGAFIDDWGANSVDEDKLKQMLKEGSEADQKKTMEGLVNAYQENTGNLEDVEREKLKNLLIQHGAQLQTGGFIPAGKTVPAILHGPELVKPVPDLESAGALGGGATTVAPTTIVNKSSGSTTMMMGSSSIDKSSWKYGMQGA